MNKHPIKRWAVGLLVVLLGLPLMVLALVLAASALFGWNWARAPLQRAVLARTGRALLIAGDLKLQFGWPNLHVQVQRVSFANPAWAASPQMLSLPAADAAIDLRALWHGQLVVDNAHLTRPVAMLEVAADGRKTWLLDSQQSDETARALIQRVTLDQGLLGFDDARANTHLRVALNTPERPQAAGAGLLYKITGEYKGLKMQATGTGGPVLALRDESTPYPLTLDATIGPTLVRADGHITGLLTLAAIDLELALSGDSLAQLFPLLGIGLPETGPYVMAGHLLHSPKLWRYDQFSGRVGQSDLAGSLQVDSGGARPFLRGEVLSQVLDFKDLGPVVGAKPGALGAVASAASAASAAASARVLPDIPFDTARWRQFDADVTLRATRIQRNQALPLDGLMAHMQMHDAVLTLDPLDFGAAGGHLKARIKLDGQPAQIAASAQIEVRKLLLNQLFPTLPLARSSIGELNGDFDLNGQGNSVGRMLGTANGRLRLRVERGEISRLLMEQIGLHLLEMAQLSLIGDKTIALNCVVADFSLKQGTLNADTLLVDTAVSTLIGSGQINLAQETLDLTIVPHTRNTSLVALRSPIYVGGTLGAPQVSLDKTRVLARAAGAVALGLLNPLLALAPLVETGPGPDGNCRQRP